MSNALLNVQELRFDRGICGFLTILKTTVLFPYMALNDSF